jgi:hypothetical protein
MEAVQGDGILAVVTEVAAGSRNSLPYVAF